MQEGVDIQLGSVSSETPATAPRSAEGHGQLTIAIVGGSLRAASILRLLTEVDNI